MGDSALITEKSFVLSHTSFWQELLPNCERFVRRMNLALTRFGEPLPSSSPPGMRGLVNELGVRLIAAAREDGIPCDELPLSKIEFCANEATAFVRRFRARPDVALMSLSSDGVEEAKRLAGWLEKFFDTYADCSLQLFPALRGFGWLDECTCDAWTSDVLFEVKAGERTFRSTDVRQVVTYLALNHLSGGKQLKTVFLVNPRRANFFRIGVEALSSETAGRGIVDVVQGIETFLLEPVLHLPSR